MRAYIPENCIRATQKILEARKYPPDLENDNKFVFALPGRKRVNGVLTLTTVAQNLGYPNITSNTLRLYLTTTTQGKLNDNMELL